MVKADKPLTIRVHCVAGYQAEETPRRFYLGERKIEVIDVLDRWLEPEHRYFKVTGDDGGTYILKHDAITTDWELILYDSGSHDATRLSPR